MKARGALFRALLLCCMGSVVLPVLHAQEPFNVPSRHFRATAYGTLIYPGMQFGVELPTRAIRVHHHHKKRTEVFQKERYWLAQAGFYAQPYVHNHYYATLNRILRKVNVRKSYHEWVFGVGLSRTWINSTVYSLDQQGNVSALRAQGNWHGVFTTGWYYGWDKRPRVKPFVGCSQMTFLGNNGMPYIRPAIELGCRFWSVPSEHMSFRFEERHKGRGLKKEEYKQ